VWGASAEQACDALKGEVMNENPYESPMYAQVPGAVPGPTGAAFQPVGLGGFVLTVVILDIVFCCLRLLLVLVGVAGYASLPQDFPLRPTAIYEFGTGFGIVVFGLLANTLILLKKRIGIPLAAVSVLFTVLSVFVGVWQAKLMAPNDLGTPEGPGFLIGACFGITVRVGLLVLYIAAVVQARKRIAQIAEQSQGFRF
jgi:hypothetical protein